MSAPQRSSRKRKLEMMEDSPQMRRRLHKRQKLIIKAPIVDLTSDTEETVIVGNTQSTISLLCPHRHSTAVIMHKTASPISPTPSLAVHRGHNNYSMLDTLKQTDTDSTAQIISIDQTQTEQTPPQDGDGTNDVPMPILNDEYADEDEVATDAVSSKHVEQSAKKTLQKTSTQVSQALAESDSGAIYLESKCCHQLRLKNDYALCEQCGDILCPNSACKQNVMCDACGYFSAEQNLCSKCDQSTVHKFSCIECGETHQQCDSCFVECTHCYTDGIAKICWNCQSDCVSLLCTHCDTAATAEERMQLDDDDDDEDEMDDKDGELLSTKQPQPQLTTHAREWKIEHRSCVAIDWQSMFEKCSNAQCPRYICTQCLYEASFVVGDRTAYHPRHTRGRFINCSQCDTGNEYFCVKHDHIHQQQQQQHLQADAMHI